MGPASLDYYIFGGTIMRTVYFKINDIIEEMLLVRELIVNNFTVKHLDGGAWKVMVPEDWKDKIIDRSNWYDVW